ncbi:MAG: hypothetical protein ACE5H9_05510 [Anaerolineae bacterium]
MKEETSEYLVEFWQGKPEYHSLSPEQQTNVLFEFLSLIATESRNTYACLLPNSGPLIIYEVTSMEKHHRLEGLIFSNVMASYFRRMAISSGRTSAATYVEGLAPVQQIIHLASNNGHWRSIP